MVPCLSILSLVRGKSTGSRKNWLLRFCCSRAPGGRGLRWRRGSFRSSGGGDAVSILFVHANYSSSVTLLEIEGTDTPLSSTPSSSLLTNLSHSFLPLISPAFSLSSQLDLLPCPGGFLMDPDYTVPLAPLPLLALPLLFFFFSAWHEISLSLLEDFTKDFNFPATAASAHRLPFAR